MALRLLQNRIYILAQLEALWMLIWITSAVSGSTFIKSPPKFKDPTFVPDGQTAEFNIVNSSFFTFERTDDFLPPERKRFDEEYDVKDIKNGVAQNHDNTSILTNSDTFIKPKILFNQESKQNVDIINENDKQNNFKAKEQKHISKNNFSVLNETVMDSKDENKRPLNHIALNNKTSTNHTYQNGHIELIESSVGVKSMQIQTQDNLPLNRSITVDKLQKTDTGLFNKYLIAERKKAASNYNSTLPLNKQKIFYHDTSNNNESSLMNDQPLQGNVSGERMEVSIKSSNERNEDNIELNEHNSTTVDDVSNETIYNDSSLGSKENIIPNTGVSLNTIVITGISLGVVIMGGIMAAGSYVIYRHRYWNKPQTLSDKCSNADSSGYIDDSTLRENSEEMYSLDNDSFLNSLEAMTIQNYWTDNVKHTKL